MRVLRILLPGLGVFLLILAAVGAFYLPGKLKVTPTDTDTVTRLSGHAQAARADGVKEYDVSVSNQTLGVPQKSDDTNVVWATFSCVVETAPGVPNCPSPYSSQWTLLNASEDHFVTDRRTGMGVQNPPAKYGDNLTSTEGLVNKWPFGAEKKTYPYWDGALGKAVDAVFDHTTTLNGLDCYVYHISVPTTPVEIASGVQGTYANETDITIDPVTGAIVNQQSKQTRLLANGSPAFIIDMAFTPEQIKKDTDSAKSNGLMLSLATKIGPIIAAILGLIALIFGIRLTRKAPAHSTKDDWDAPAHA